MEDKLILAPMADYTDYPFRETCRKFGSKYTFTEMISVDSIVMNNQKIHLMLPQKGEKNIGIQLFGNDPIKFMEAAKIVENLASWIDINAACPVNKVIKKGAGAALLDTPELLAEIIYSLKNSVNVPVGVKMRLGFNKINIEENATLAESAGADYIIIHGRTRNQFYSGKTDKSIFKKIKKIVKIPVGASGDVFTLKDYEEYINNYCADFVLVARGAIGNPWIFLKRNYIPSLEERIKTCLEHLQLSIEFYKNEVYAVKKFRKILIKYFTGIAGVTEIKRKIFTTISYKEVEDLLYTNLLNINISLSSFIKKNSF